MCNGHCRIGDSLIIHYLELFRREQQLIDKWIRVIGNLKRIIGSSYLTTQSILRKDVYFWFLPDVANNSKKQRTLASAPPSRKFSLFLIVRIIPRMIFTTAFNSKKKTLKKALSFSVALSGKIEFGYLPLPLLLLLFSRRQMNENSEVTWRAIVPLIKQQLS